MLLSPRGAVSLASRSLLLLLLFSARVEGCARPPASKPSGASDVRSTPVLSEPAAGGDLAELDRLVADVCGKQVVLLGEPGGHGDGRTQETKGVLVTRLIDECGFDAVFFESGIYDFVDFAHALAADTATPARLSNAINEFWARTEESQQWIPQLFARARAGRITLAGLDGQIHTTAVYARRQLVEELTSHLTGDTRSQCRAALVRYMNWQYDEKSPYSDDVRQRLRACLDEAAAALAKQPPSRTRDEHIVMAASLRRILDDDFENGGALGFNTRDRLMYDNFEWHRRRLAPDSRIIVWCATIHAAKDLRGVDGYEGLVPLGAYVHAAYGDRTAAIGFSAYAGSWAGIRRPARPIPEAPPGSLEAIVAPHDGLRYLGPDQLQELGDILSRPLSHDAPKRARWSEVIDGLIVFREERPPRFLDSRE